MPWPLLITGFIIGLAGSLHCIGMCGPLSLALPTWHLSKGKKFFSVLSYQLGRIITYSVLGFIFGVAGRGFYMADLQQGFSIVLGSIFVISALFYFTRRQGFHISVSASFYTSVQRWIGKILKNNLGPTGFLFLGMANGLLPCGMVYIALATTVSLGLVVESVIFMALFGAGTLPAMMLIAYAGQFIKPEIRIVFRKAIPYVVAMMGLMLILRGLNLGILYLSPELENSGTKPTITCG